MARLKLLPREALLVTGPVDHADWNYRPVLSRIQRQRYRLALKALPASPVDRLLEVGYGSGVFLPELAARSRSLHGIDVHPHAEAVQARLSEYGVQADLHSGSAADLPFPDGHFDTVVTVSTLEFVEPMDEAVREIRRVLRPSGSLVVVTPGQSRLLDAGLFLLTGVRAKRDFGDGRARVMPALEPHFRVASRHVFPGWLLGRVLPVYTCLKLAPR